MSTTLAALELPTAGRLGHLTPEQSETLVAFRSALLTENLLNPLRHENHTLLRFLRARQFVLVDALNMIRKYELWRKDSEIDKLCREFQFTEANQVRKLYPQYYHFTDKLGRPIYVESLANIKVNDLLKITTIERMKQNLIVEYERTINFRMPACSIAASKKSSLTSNDATETSAEANKAHSNIDIHIEQSCTIIDAKNVTLWNSRSVVGLISDIADIGQNYYPEVLGAMFVINVSGTFTALWSLVERFIDKNTSNKIKVLSTDKTLPELSKYIDAQYIPSIFGGKCECCDKLISGIVPDNGPWTTVSQAEIDAYLHAHIPELKKWCAEKCEKDATLKMPDFSAYDGKCSEMKGKE